MSRTNKPRGWKKRSGGGHHYRSSYFNWLKRVGNKWMRQAVRQQMKDISFKDDFDEKRLPDRKEDLFDRWRYD